MSLVHGPVSPIQGEIEGECSPLARVPPLEQVAGELRREDEHAGVQPFRNDFRAQPVGGGLQQRHIVNVGEGAVAFAQPYVSPLKFSLHEGCLLRF
jgi:hypothetical protein